MRLFVAFRGLLWSSCFVATWVWVATLVRRYDARVGVSLPAWTKPFGWEIGIAGLLLAAWCVVTFVTRGRGTPAPFDPPREFVATGPYRAVRNPMYLGGALGIVGGGIAFGSPSIVLMACAYLLAAHLLVVFYEEPTLAGKFGESYARYRATVHRWIPRRPRGGAAASAVMASFLLAGVASSAAAADPPAPTPTPVPAPVPTPVPKAVPKPGPKLGWFNATELSVVLTDGNSKTQTFGFKNTLKRIWMKSRFEVKLDYLRADTADDRYLQVVPGVTFVPGDRPFDAPTFLVTPPVEPDVEKFFAEAKYSKDFLKRTFWSVGASWDRNEDAGILDRYIGFGTVGHRWWDREDLHWATSGGLSYTDREEEFTEPGRLSTFMGVRLTSDLRMKMSKSTTFDNDVTTNVSLKDLQDYNFDISCALTVAMTKHVSLKTSLQWIYARKPAIEDVDVIARVVLEDPDGIPGSGDEFFRTVSEGGSEVALGEGQAHKEQLDTIFRTTLVIDF